MNANAWNNDIWTFSVTSFTAVIIIVTLKLMVTERYFTWVNLVSIFVLSLGIYFCYIWASNFTGFSNTYETMQVLFSSSQYYLTIGLCVTLCYGIDIFIRSLEFEFKTTPTDFLRKCVNMNLPIEQYEDEFNEIYNKIKQKLVKEDLKREELLEQRRKRILKKKGISESTPQPIEHTINVKESGKGPQEPINQF